MPSAELFEGLEEEYMSKVSDFRQEFPRINFTTVSRRVKNSQKMMISARSPNKEDLFKPQRIISALFTPKPIQLQSHEYTFLSKTHQGETLLEDLEYAYDYKIYFGFDKHEKQLKVYC
jgi:hypothetical protein